VSVGVLFHNGVMGGWLTRESGQHPVCSDERLCINSAKNGGKRFTPSQVRKAYVVVQAGSTMLEHYRSAVFGELSVENVEIVLGCAARVACTKGRDRSDDCCVRQLGVGFRESSSGRCLCDTKGGEHRKGLVGRQSMEMRRFVLVSRYCGPFPNGGVPWFTGVTDVMDARQTLFPLSGVWLAC
jgi:hypothetical protein